MQIRVPVFRRDYRAYDLVQLPLTRQSINELHSLSIVLIVPRCFNCTSEVQSRLGDIVAVVVIYTRRYYALVFHAFHVPSASFIARLLRR